MVVQRTLMIQKNTVTSGTLFSIARASDGWPDVWEIVLMSFRVRHGTLRRPDYVAVLVLGPGGTPAMRLRGRSLRRPAHRSGSAGRARPARRQATPRRPAPATNASPSE